MRYLTAGESHGPQLTVIIEGIPSQLHIDKEKIDGELARRQKGYGRGRRMQIEKDQVKILSGVRFGRTTGAPLTLVIENRDFSHWKNVMSVDPVPEEAEKRKITRPRPGHADLNGAIKYQHRDIRDILERSSARETAARVAAGAVARLLLEDCEIDVAGHVIQIANIEAKPVQLPLDEIKERSELSPVRCLDQEAEKLMMARIDQAKEEGDSLGGIVETIVAGVPVGLGSHVHWDRKLDAKIAQAVVSINAFKGVEFGLGFEAARLNGSEVHDEIAWSKERGFYRRTNRLGGLEGGMTTGEPIIVRGAMKPIPTLYKPLQSVDIETKQPFQASIERSDSCAVPAASVVMENVVAWEIARALVEKFSSDNMGEMVRQLKQYRERVMSF